jgi:SulP family sulfate permease
VLFDLSEVSHLGVTASLALENAIKEAIEVGRLVYVVVHPGATRKRLEKLKLLDLLPEDHVSASRYEVLLRAVNQLPQLQELSS